MSRMIYSTLVACVGLIATIAHATPAPLEQAEVTFDAIVLNAEGRIESFVNATRLDVDIFGDFPTDDATLIDGHWTAEPGTKAHAWLRAQVDITEDTVSKEDLAKLDKRQGASQMDIAMWTLDNCQGNVIRLNNLNYRSKQSSTQNMFSVSIARRALRDNEHLDLSRGPSGNRCQTFTQRVGSGRRTHNGHLIIPVWWFRGWGPSVGEKGRRSRKSGGTTALAATVSLRAVGYQASMPQPRKSAAVLVGFGVVATIATPLPNNVPRPGPLALLDALEQLNSKVMFGNEDKICHEGDFGSIESAKEHWDLVQGSKVIDNFISKENGGTPVNWLKNFEKHILKDVDRTGADGCTVLQGSCKPGRAHWSCSQYFKMKPASDTKKSAFWVFKAVQGFHNVMNEYYRQLQDETIITGLNIDKMIDDLDGAVETSDNMIDWVSAAFGMLGSGFGPFPGLGEGYGIIGSMLSLTAGEEKEPINGEISAGLAESYAATTKGLTKTLELVMGKGSDEDYKKFLDANGKKFNSKIANFFNTGAWLVEIDGSGVVELIQEAVGNIERKVAHEANLSKGWVLVINDLITSSEECYDGKFGRSWMEYNDKSYCVSLYFWEEDLSYIREPKEEFVEKLEQYGLSNLELYYRSIMDCALKGGKSTLTLNPLEPSKVPHCFFKMPVYQLEKKQRCGKYNLCKEHLKEVGGAISDIVNVIAPIGGVGNLIGLIGA
ncbi:hypothetical protein HJFPF1_09534 [Paramyrothecium foliicola]|nr:hypothetical protein HJFPF1_09534 [Paramyrothecium foliicola]